ncbi:MAG: HIRAN domain-containing protein [Lentisphaeria bacterium]|nr:HIRAN domain-containing protein [Lentisphaeria bacterium]
MADSDSLVPYAQWLAIKGAFGKGGVPMPFVQEIFLLECHVAGTSHIAGIGDLADTVPVGELLAFVRERDNPHDGLAILICNRDSHKLGYVPQAKNEVLARLMDAGKLIFGKVEYSGWKENWLRIVIKVYMRDL